RYDATIGDINGDGMQDAVEGSTYGDIKTYFRQPSGVFSMDRVHVLNVYSTVTPRVIGDVNEDGKADVVASSNNELLVLLGNGDATFKTPLITELDSPIGSIKIVGFGRDKNPDLLVGHDSAGADALQGNGDGTFGKQITTQQGYTDIAADVTGDGVEDLVYS